MFNKLKNLFSKKELQIDKGLPEPKKTPKITKAKEPELSEKDKATRAGEPYVTVVRMDLDPTNINAGAFELDFNEIFVAKLVKAGYMMNKNDTDTDIVDRWFTQVCRNVVLEIFEQQQADPTKRESDLMRPTVNRKDLGNGRAEMS